MTQGMGLDEFLGHSSSFRGSSGKVLNWRKRQPPIIDTWLHTKGRIIALWRHGWPRLVEIEHDGDTSTEVWSGFFNCWENEDVLRRQHRRTDDGARLVPPKICPVCLLLEHLREQVRVGALSWLEPVFKFEGDDPKQTVVLTAAGMYNGFGGDLTRQELYDLKRAGVRRDEAWRQNTTAKCNYLFCIVDHNEPEKGVQTAIETTALGDAVKRVIRDQMDALGEEEGHPLKHPYAIRWEYRAQEQEFGKKYRALAMPKLALTPEVRDLIYDAPLPEIGELIARGNVAALRSVMEQHALISLPFDSLFAAAEAATGQVLSQQEPRVAQPRQVPRVEQSQRRDVSPQEEPRAASSASMGQRKPAKSQPAQPTFPPGTVMLPCDACGAPMAETDEVCWKCGARYEIDDDNGSSGSSANAPSSSKASASGAAGKEVAQKGQPRPTAVQVSRGPVPRVEPGDVEASGAWPGEPADDLPF